MKDIKDMINEAFNQKKWEDGGCPVMYSIYGDANGPWYFGHTNQHIEHGQMKVFSNSTDYVGHFAKLVIPFEQFDPYKMENNKKYNLVK